MIKKLCRPTPTHSSVIMVIGYSITVIVMVAVIVIVMFSVIEI